jgi:hypothetical protein
MKKSNMSCRNPVAAPFLAVSSYFCKKSIQAEMQWRRTWFEAACLYVCETADKTERCSLCVVVSVDSSRDFVVISVVFLFCAETLKFFSPSDATAQRGPGPPHS